MSSIYSIYKATNTITGKSYIGFDSCWPNRKKSHKNRMCEKNNIKFYNALRKYGWDNFIWEVIYQSLDGKHCLSVMEPFFIKENNSFCDGYNSTLGGEGVIGYKHNDEKRKKIGLIATGRKQSKETINKRVENIKLFWSKNQKVISIEQKNKISKTLKRNIPWNKGLKTNRPSPNQKSVIIDGVFYDSKKEATEKLNLSLYMLNKIINNSPVTQNSSYNKSISHNIT